ncbi:Clp protease ClpB [Neobacillus mesonae]|uniref:Clp protease ClpB n=1 Tax=Neobacillus mesonae TaxID=1193713 RepID=A0A3Q9QQW6_9BACI|nr:Clp protease ClpB [Neobacillus mesonae]AZU61066.1 hypothetical protein CHR53_07260 [Neobacillus mesonae]
MSEVNQNPEVVTENPTVVEPENKPEVKMVTMSQEAFDALIVKEKGRVKSKYADYDDLKTKASEYEKVLEEKRLAELSAQERAEELAKKFEAERNEYAKQLEELKSQAQREKVVNAFIKAAPGVNIPADRIDAALKLADLSAVTVGENGVEGLDAVMGTLVEQYAFLAETKKPQKPIGEPSNSPKETADKTSDQLLREAAEKAKRTGRTEDLAAYAKLQRELRK